MSASRASIMSQQNCKTPMMVLQELTVKLGIDPPEYVLLHSKVGTHDNEFHYLLKVADVKVQGFGRSKQVAKHNAASSALELLEKNGIYNPSWNPVQEFNPQSHRNESDSPLMPSVNYIGALHDYCYENKLPAPIFNEISDVGPPHDRTFTYECKVAAITKQQTAKTKKQAKQLAARDMLESVKTICPPSAEEIQAETKALTELDDAAINKYQEICIKTLNVIPNRTVQVEDFPLTLKKMMVEKNLEFSHFEEHFKKRDRESLNEILSKLDINFDIFNLQDSPCIKVFHAYIDTPLDLMAHGVTEAEAEKKLLWQIFEHLEILMNINLNHRII